jgi:hypothetical protein
MAMSDMSRFDPFPQFDRILICGLAIYDDEATEDVRLQEKSRSYFMLRRTKYFAAQHGLSICGGRLEQSTHQTRFVIASLSCVT